MRRISTIIRELPLIGLCLLVALWLSAHSLGSITAMPAPRKVLKPFASRSIAFSAKKMATVWLKGKTEATVYRVYHIPPDSWRIEYLAPREASGRVMIQTNRKIWQVEPSYRRIFVTSVANAIEVYEKMDRLLLANYSTERLSTVTEAHRKCDMLRLVPKHPGKSCWLIWVDRKTGVIIKRERYGADGSLEMVSQYTEFRPGKVDESVFDTSRLPRYPIVNQRWSVEDLERSMIPRYTGLHIPRKLPSGFSLKSAYRIGDSNTTQLMFSDGLCVISLFANDGDPAVDVPDSPSHRVKVGGAEGVSKTVGSMTCITWKTHGHTCTLIADVSERVMLDLAKSLM